MFSITDRLLKRHFPFVSVATAGMNSDDWLDMLSIMHRDSHEFVVLVDDNSDWPVAYFKKIEK